MAAIIRGLLQKMSHLINYSQGSDILTNLETNWQDLVVKDVEGKAYGLEVILQKKIGKFNGWVSYTRSISERRSTQINLGAWYPSRYQREHNIAITANYQFAKKWFLSTNWVYQTGYPVTLP